MTIEYFLFFLKQKIGGGLILLSLRGTSIVKHIILSTLASITCLKTRYVAFERDNITICGF